MKKLSGLRPKHLLSSEPLEAVRDQSDFVDKEEHERGFAAYFEREIKPLRDSMESQRINALDTIRIRFQVAFPFIVVLIVLIVVDFMAYWKWDWSGLPGPLDLVLLWGPIFGLIVYVYRPVADYRKSIKKELLSRIARFYGDDWSYQLDGGFDAKVIETSYIAPLKSAFVFQDCFSGAYRGVKISFAEIHLPGDPGKRESRIKGLCLLFSMNKRFDGKTVVVQDRGGWFRRNKKQLGDMERVELEDPEFEAMFEAYGTDQVEGRYLLTTAFMDRTLQLSRFFDEMGAGTEIQFEFRDQNLLMIIPSTVDYFEPGTVFEPAIRISDMRKLLKEMALIFGVVDALKLNLKLGL